MDEQQRLHYLRAMGITQWERRVRPPEVPQTAPAPHSSAAPAGEPSTRPASTTEPARERPAVPHLRVVDGGSRAVEPEPANPVEPVPSGPASMGWDKLAERVAGCRKCALCETRTQTVFGVGSHSARLMLVGEAPGADEDRRGEPFVGRAGQLLTRMLDAIGLQRDEVFIANVLKCRPPGNRDPRPDEMRACEGYLQRQIALLRPQVILTLGRISAQHLLATDTPVGRLRGRWFNLGEERTAVRVTYHPAYLLRSPAQKARAWEDLVEVARRLHAG